MRLNVVPETEADLEMVRKDQVRFALQLEVCTVAQMGRALQSCAALGVFEAMADGPKTPDEIASGCGLALRAIRSLVEALGTTIYVRKVGEKYELTDQGRRWMLGLGRGGFADFVGGGSLEIEWATDLMTAVRTGRSLPVLSMMTPERWELYERAQLALTRAREATLLSNVPVPHGARAMLDIGAAHGHRAVAFCRKYLDMSATVLDLPAAVEASVGLLQAAAMGKRVLHRAADPITADLGVEAYDLIVTSSSLARFTRSQSSDLMKRCALALRPSGLLVIDDFFRFARASEGGQQAALVALLLTVTSEDGPFTIEDAAAWQRESGLEPLPSVVVDGGMVTLQMARKR